MQNANGLHSSDNQEKEQDDASDRMPIIARPKLPKNGVRENSFSWRR
jgi:hypothetical protein